MTVDQWLQSALGDADRRGLAELRPLLEGLARATASLRAADWNIDLTDEPADPPAEHVR